MSSAEPPLVETQAVHDIFVSGVARVDPLGSDIYRITFYAENYCTFDGRRERNVVARFVIHDCAIKRGRAFVSASISQLKLAAANDNGHQTDSR